MGGVGLTEALSGRGEGVGGTLVLVWKVDRLGERGRRAACWEVACEAGVGGWGHRRGGRGAEAQ